MKRIYDLMLSLDEDDHPSLDLFSLHSETEGEQQYIDIKPDPNGRNRWETPYGDIIEIDQEDIMEGVFNLLEKQEEFDNADWETFPEDRPEFIFLDIKITYFENRKL